MKAQNYFRKAVFIAGITFLCIIATNAQTYNFITTGDMESGGWTAVPGNTNLVRSFEADAGINGSTALKTVTTSMGGDNYYILRCEEFFHMDYNDRITISFWAKGSVADMRLQAWVQEADGYEWMNFGDAYLTTNWKLYRFSVYLSTQTSDNYKIKFRGYNTGTMYIDDVQIGPIDYEDVAQSGIYNVTISQNGMAQPINVFRNTCPTFSLGYQGMEAKDEHPLDLFSGRTINWTKFSFEGSMTVHVIVINTDKVPVSGQTVKILPSRYGISSSTNGNVVTFTITEPGQYSVEIGPNGYKNGLIIFADPLETDIPSQSDTNYLVLYEATANDVSSIPGTYSGVYFRRGVHNIGVFDIPSNIKNIYFEDGSWVYGALEIDGGPGVRIYGRGVLSSANLNYRQAHCVEAQIGSDSVTIEGLVVADPKYFGIRLLGRDNEVNYAKIIGGWVYNCDGICVFKRSNVSNCFIWANDDAIKAYRDSITYSDMVVWSLNNGAVIQMSWGGAVGGSTAKDVKISTLDVLRAEWDQPRFNNGLLNCVGNHNEVPGKYALLEDWLIEDLTTERTIPLIFNITPDDYTHNHIHGLTLKDWDVEMDMNTDFTNQIKGEDPEDFFSGFVFNNVVFNDELLTNINYITTGDMESGGWVAVPKTTDQVVTLAQGFGTGGSIGLRSVVTDMGGGNHYVIKCNEKFHMTQNEEITVSFWAKATAADKRLVPWVQETDYYTWMNMGDFDLTTSWKWYTCTETMSLSTSDNYQVKFRGYETAWIFIDKVQIGPPDWRTLTEIEIQYLNTPTFIPNTKSLYVNTSSKNILKNTSPVYPNPVSEVLFIGESNSRTKYEVFSTSGSLMLTGQGTQMDVSALKAGLYILVTNDGRRMKFIKE